MIFFPVILISEALYPFNNNKQVSCFNQNCLTLKIINIKKLAINTNSEIIVKTHHLHAGFCKHTFKLN